MLVLKYLLILIYKKINGQRVAYSSEPGDDTGTMRGDEGNGSESFAGQDIRQVHFYNGGFYRGNGIGY